MPRTALSTNTRPFAALTFAQLVKEFPRWRAKRSATPALRSAEASASHAWPVCSAIQGTVRICKAPLKAKALARFLWVKSVPRRMVMGLRMTAIDLLGATMTTHLEHQPVNHGTTEPATILAAVIAAILGCATLIIRWEAIPD